ncbi:hypothetical protein ElyMa_003927200 [Elysia marginata]|uniref:Uncharacterized protein n=1 Tax=Elysia marginata TaxID=1093978 RepID=A0AAV4FQL6_9GAST|nr:hypothetical protein ElyMa_003927200 [Elysia marginata]
MVLTSIYVTTWEAKHLPLSFLQIAYPVGATIQRYLLRLPSYLDREVTEMQPRPYHRPATLPSPTAPCRAHGQKVNNGRLLLRDGIRDVR